MTCFYCRRISVTTPGYPARPAVCDLGSAAPRCMFHWRYICRLCQQPRHFMATAFCPAAGAYYCDRCAASVDVVADPFYGWTYYFRYGSPWTGVTEPALDRLEFEERHPLQGAAEPQMGTSVSKERWLARPARPAQQVAAITDDDARVSWDDNAGPWEAAFDVDGDEHRKYICDEPLLALVGDVKDRNVLDLGCGNGYFSRKLARLGARVTGVDVSEQMICTAVEHERRQPLGIRYLTASATDLGALEDAYFDAVVCNHVLTSIADYEPALSEAHRVLRTFGRMTAVISHPCFSCGPRRWEMPAPDSPRPEEADGYIVDHYLQAGAYLLDAWPGFSPVPYFHRPLSDYWHTFKSAGFIVEDFSEPGPGDRGRAELPARRIQQAERIPLSCIFQLSRAAAVE